MSNTSYWNVSRNKTNTKKIFAHTKNEEINNNAKISEINITFVKNVK